MRVFLNGEAREVEEGRTLEEALAGWGAVPSDRPVAVLVNGEVVPSHRRTEVVLSEGDRVELVSFIGGG